MAKNKTGAVWEDREVLFDLPFSYLRLRPGERIFDRIEPIEDTKGNSRMKGRMVVTSLRIIWHSLSSPRINLSVGLHCIQSISTKVVNSGLRGTTQALYVLAAYKTNKYEFIFTNLAPSCVRHYTSVVGVHKAYGASRLYRELKLRAAVIGGKALRLLPLEKILLNEHSIWNLSSDAGNLGTMLVTNIRVVWFADVNESFNVSMPYITIESIAIRDSKFGQALVCVVRQTSGGYVLGFRADPPDRLRPLFAELQALHQAYMERPIFGVEFNWGTEPAKPVPNEIEELEEIGEPRGEMGPNLYLASQLAQNDESTEVLPIYSSYLGLAIEPLKEGFTLKSLFEVQTSTKLVVKLMDKENSKSASNLRRSLLAERIRIRQEWAQLKGTDGPATSADVLKKRTQNKNVHKIMFKPAGVKKPQSSSDALRGVVALVEVGSEPRALALRAALAALGASVVPAWSPLVTHLVWANGGCRATRAKARALASRLVSPLWVEACAAANRRLPERTFPAAARDSDLPSPATLRRLLKKAEMENIPLVDLLSDSNEGAQQKPLRLRISSDHSSSDSSGETTESTDVEPETRVNTAPRRALPASTTPVSPKRSRRKLFTQREPGTDTEASEAEEESKRKHNASMLTHRHKKDLARAERMAKRLAGATPGKPKRNASNATQERPRIVLTGMTRIERNAVTNAVHSLNGKLQARVTRKTTHVLLGSCREHTGYITGIGDLNTTTENVIEIQRCDRHGRTLNALLGAARGCRVLYAQWALDSCKEKKWIHHLGYEVPHLKKISQKARVERKATRLMRAEYAYNVFNGMRVRIASDLSQKDAAIQLLTLCGAVVLGQNGGVTQNGRSCLTQYGRSCLTQYGRTQNGEVRTTEYDIVLGNGNNNVNSKWVFDSVAAARMRTTRKYVT